MRKGQEAAVLISGVVLLCNVQVPVRSLLIAGGECHGGWEISFARRREENLGAW